MAKKYVNKENCYDLTGFAPEELARLTGIEAYTSKYIFEVSGTSTAPRVVIDSADGRVHMSRTYMLEVNEVENNRFEVRNTNEGVGRLIFARQITELKNTKFAKITCIAAKSEAWNGYYTWARFGFIIDEDEIQDIIDYLAKVQYQCMEHQPHKIVLDPNHKEWWRLNGITWTGTFDLTEGSESMNIFKNYLKEKELK